MSFGQSTIWSVEKCTADDTSETCRPPATLMAFVLSAAVYGPSALLAQRRADAEQLLGALVQLALHEQAPVEVLVG